MAKHNANQDSSISDSLHPFVNIAIIGLVLMFVAAVWMFFDSDRYEAWLDVVVTGLFVIAIAIPALCWLTWRRNAQGARDYGHVSFRDWAVGEFDTWTGPVKGANATAEVPLPIVAVAVGMTLLGLVFHVIASGERQRRKKNQTKKLGARAPQILGRSRSKFPCHRKRRRLILQQALAWKEAS